MSAKDEIYAMGIAEGFVTALSEEDKTNKDRFDELVAVIMETTEVSEDTAKYYANRYWGSHQ